MNAGSMTSCAKGRVGVSPLATSRSGAARTERAIALSRARRCGVVVRAEDEEEAKGVMADIGLGDLEEVMEKAGGGSTSSDMLPEDLDGVTAFLGSEDVDFAQKLLVEKYGESLYRELGFTKQSETINGRLAMVGFLAGFGALFTGDILTQFAKAPLPSLLVSAAIITATLVPTAKPEGYVPAGVKDAVMKAYEGAGLDEIFTPKAELINGRGAMIGIFALVLLSVIF